MLAALLLDAVMNRNRGSKGLNSKRTVSHCIEHGQLAHIYIHVHRLPGHNYFYIPRSRDRGPVAGFWIGEGNSMGRDMHVCALPEMV